MSTGVAETTRGLMMPATAHLDVTELPFYYLGLNTVTKRFAAGLLATGGILFATKPSSMFEQDGTPREWKLVSNEPSAVYLPWWTYSLLVGGILATFI
jgi:hypothetical protein